MLKEATMILDFVKNKPDQKTDLFNIYFVL